MSCIDKWAKDIKKMQSHRVHDLTDTEILQAISKRRRVYNKELLEYYGTYVAEKDVWPGYCNKFFPQWYCDTLMKEFVNIPCMDHARVVKFENGGSPQIISEPYNSTMADMKELIQFCEQRGLDFQIDGDSAHFPGRCYRIIFK